MYTFLLNFYTFSSPLPSFLLVFFRLLRDASAPRLNVCFLQGDTIARSFFLCFFPAIACGVCIFPFGGILAAINSVRYRRILSGIYPHRCVNQSHA